jgi:hypothetical protein
VSRLTFEVILGCLLIAAGSPAFAEEHAVTVPQHGDDYAKYVATLERGETTIDYLAFRESFLRSPQFKIKMNSNYSELEKTLEEKVQQRDLAAVLRYTKLLLDIDYTSMIAHKYRQQTFKILGDDANQEKYHQIEFGLLKSIVRNGDGEACRTAWPVVQIEEEYFILKMLGAKLKEQQISTDGGVCDAMKTMTDGEERIYFFDVSRVFQKRRQLLDAGKE